MKKLLLLATVILIGFNSFAQCPQGPADFEPDFDATTLTVGVRTQVAATTWGGEYQSLTNVNAGDNITVDVCGAPYAADLTVFDPSNIPVAFGSNICGDDGSVTFVAGSSGTYDLQPNNTGCTSTATNTGIFVTINSFAATCTDPDVPTITASSTTICTGASTTLNWAGANLNDATNWHVYTTNCGTGQIASQTGTSLVVSPATTTTYYIRGEDGAGCVDESTGLCGSITITVNPLDDASFSYSASAYCVSDSDPTPTITGLGGGTFSSSPAGLSINPSTGAIDVSISTPSTYTVTYTTSGACPNSSNVAVTINGLDDASFSYSAGSYCVSDSDPTPTITGLGGGTFSSSPAGLSINPSTGAIDVSISTPNSYTVTYTTSGSCPNSSNVAVTINGLDDASFSYSAGSYCVSDSDPTPTITGLGGGTFSSSPAGLSINPSTGAIDVSISTPSTYTVTYTTSGACPNSSNVAVTINGLDDASFSYSAGSYCVSDSDPTPTITGLAGGTFSSSPAGLSINPSTGAIDVSISTPSTYTVTYTTSGACPNSSNVAVTINGLDDASFSYSASAYCVSDSDPTPTITGLGGGTFSSAPAGLSINPSTGAIDVSISTPNSYTVTYTTSGACPNSSNVAVTINGGSPASYTALADLCINAGVQSGLGSGSPTGGVYSGTGVTDDGNGMTYSFDPAAAGVGTHTITYTVGGCSGSANDNVEVFNLPTVTFTALADLCIDAGVQAGLGGGSPTGGVYSGPGVTDDGNGMTYSFDPAAAGVGVHTLSYTFTDGNGCSGSANDNAEVFALPSVTFTALADLCIDAGVQAGLGGGSPTGGVYSGPGVTDDGNGMTYSFDPVAAGVGAHTITYSLTDGNGCSGSANDNAEVFALPSVTFTALADLCIDAGVQAGLGGGSPTGGVYSGPGVTDDGNGMTYSFDPAAAGVGVHTISYNYTDGNGCSSSANDNAEVFNLPTVTFTALADLCPNAGVQSGLGGGSPTGGIYSGPGVTDDGNGMTYTFDPAAAGIGVHTLTYTYTDGNGCSGSANDNVNVDDTTAPTISGCPANMSVNANQLGCTADVTWTAPTESDNCSGVTMTSSHNSGDNFPLGTTTITYTATDAVGNTAVCSFDVTVVNDLALALDSVWDASCADTLDGQAFISGSGGVGPFDFDWDHDGTGDIDVQNQGGLGAGTFNVVGTDQSTGCTATTMATIAEPTALTVSVTAVNPSGCGVADGSTDATIAGGTMAYDIDWDNNGAGGGDPEDLTGIGAGAYVIMVTDANGCTTTASATLSDPSGPTVAIDSIWHNDCNADTVGAVFATIAGGTGALDIDWDNNGVGGGDPEDIINLSAGTYNVTVTDAIGCVSSGSATVNEAAAITVTPSTTDVLCNGDTTGTAMVSPAGGTGALVEDWGTANPAMLPVGTHVYTVTDDNMCVLTDSVVITEPDALAAMDSTINISCNGMDDGESYITALGGTPGYTIVWAPADTSSFADSLTGGNHVYMITDANGCMYTDSVMITDPAALALSATTTDETTPGNNGAIDLTVTGGTPGYTYDWDSGTFTTEDLTGLTGGSYHVMVTDTNGCSDTLTVVVNSTVGIATIDNKIGVSVYPNPNNGQFNINITDADSDVSIEIMDMIGKRILFIQNANPTDTISLDEQSGVYLVKITKDDHSVVKRVIIER